MAKNYKQAALHQEGGITKAKIMKNPAHQRMEIIEKNLLEAMNLIDNSVHQMIQLQTDADIKNCAKLTKHKNEMKNILQQYDRLARKRS